ncbi:hypothetical protein KP509_01G027500 [Ceratopteris richardii]|uniref:Flavanone 4-reductase n=1 Tax=Ceratopteris richardii TaxID=49495 RepID=A0A8T2VJU2_CERRI|nr:hypothetical protein KP509_01G027500 [Ceratopteris richardii]KAH7445896.1 hypothetical protein KP509_01G027500 [Ceratopteris richardii]
MRQGGGCHNPALPFREGDTEGNTSSRVYCVTGANGLLASWLIKCLLERGFHVRGSLRNIEKGEPLRHLAGAEERLELFEADLLDETSLPPVIRGCHGVFAVASPLPSSHQDEGGVIDLMTAATINLLKACRDAGTVKRVVFTSSMFAALQVPHEGISCLSVDESFWTSPEYCREQRMASWSYMAGKTEAEKVALEFGNENGLEVVSILPSFVGGPFVGPPRRFFCFSLLGIHDRSSGLDGRCHAWFMLCACGRLCAGSHFTHGGSSSTWSLPVFSMRFLHR